MSWTRRLRCGAGGSAYPVSLPEADGKGDGTVVHATTVHSRSDIRIRVKQAASISKATGRRVVLFVQDGQGAEQRDISGVEVVDTGCKLNSRPLRMTLGAWRMWRKVLMARPSVVHFHDPELIPVGLMLKAWRVKVVYDVHENLPRQILGKFWLPGVFRKPVAWAMAAVERIAARIFDAIVPATPKIAGRFPADKTVVVQNFPILQELAATNPVSYPDRPPYFAYVGGITRARGALEMVKSMSQLDGNGAMLKLAGVFMPWELQGEVEGLAGWEKVDFLGWTDRGRVAELLGRVRAGLVLLHPTEHYPDAYPVKMFEYMAAGLPVIASDFALWREIVDGSGCGLLVDPLDPDAIARAMQWVLDHPDQAEAMGRRGRRAVAEKYNWEQEAEKLVSLYGRLLENYYLP